MENTEEYNEKDIELIMSLEVECKKSLEYNIETLEEEECERFYIKCPSCKTRLEFPKYLFKGKDTSNIKIDRSIAEKIIKYKLFLSCKKCGRLCCNVCATYARVKLPEQILDDKEKSFEDQEVILCEECWDSIERKAIN